MSSSDNKKTTLALTMIVKNESKVISRCFDSLSAHLDYWVIHDTGSTDGTPELIEKYFAEKGIPGELHHTPWKDFGYNRSKAVADTKGKADYTLLFDADFIFKLQDPNFKEKLGQMNSDGYLIKYEGGLDYRQNLCVRTNLNWYYKGVTHEFIHTPEAKRIIPFDGFTIDHKADGGSRDDKFDRDIALLEQGLIDEPDNGRYCFYLGQSYKDLGGINKNLYDYKKRLIEEYKKKLAEGEHTDEVKAQLPQLKEQLAKMETELPELEKKYTEYLTKCLVPYRRRAEMGGWGEEVYYSYLQMGLAKMRRGDDFYDFMGDLLHAFMSRPSRLESLFHLVRHCRLHGMAPLGFHLGKMAENSVYPKDLLFIDKGVHDWGFWDEFALCAHMCREHELAVKIGRRIITENKYPDREDARLKRNLDYYEKALATINPNDKGATDSKDNKDSNEIIELQNKLKSAEDKLKEVMLKLYNEEKKVVGGDGESMKNVRSDGGSIKSVEGGDEGAGEKSKRVRKVRFVDEMESKEQEAVVGINSSGKAGVVAMDTNQRKEFIRIKPEVKENRLAVIIANYNMFERADMLAEYLKEHTEWPMDVILVDNGSDQAMPSKYSSLMLGRNVQTTHAWLMGLNYADSLEVFENFKYLAYSFVITSSEIVKDQGDIITKLMKSMLDDSEVVGIHPALSEDSTTWWKHLIHRSDGTGWRHTNMLDNIFSIYRADWFNQIGRFNPSLTYAWGIDMETSYFARRDSKKLMINDDVIVKKITNVGYEMDRMNMTSGDRFNNARKQIEEYFTAKYGTNYNDIVSKAYRIPEFLRAKPNVEEIMKGFTNREGGHRALMELLRDQQEKYAVGKFRTEDSQLNLVEIGCNREEWPHFNSTYKLAALSEKYGYHFWSIDADLESITNAKRMINYPNFHPINAVAENFLPNFPGKIHFVYLDGYDLVLSPTHHSTERKAKYAKYLNGEMTNEKCYQMHLDTVRLLDKKMAVGGVICFNDINNLTDFKFKGRTAIPYLLRTGRYSIIKHANNTLLLTKNEDDSASHRSVDFKTAETLKDPKKRFIVTLTGYTNERNKHTNWYPWNRFLDVYKTMGYDAEWIEIEKLSNRCSESNPRPRIFICWNNPTCVELVKSGVLHHTDVVIQKLTSLGKGMENVNWGDNPTEYFSTWNWPIYQTVEYLLESGFNIYAFGCQSHSEDFPEKQRIVKKLEKLNRLFWINWGSTVFNYQEIQNCKPVMDEFQYDLGYVGSKWGTAGRGNTDQWSKFIEPVVNEYKDLRCGFYGSGFPEGMISDEQSKQVLRKSKICPILHAPSWVAEKGIQDRFYTVFTAGRFGVVDNPGVYDFFSPDEVVCEVDPEKYREKTLYYLNNVAEQQPFIEKVQEKIRTKYNLYTQWDQILTQIITEQQDYREESHDFLSKVGQIYKLDKPFYSKEL